MIPDLGKDAPVDVNENGGMHSKLDVSLVGLPPKAILAIGKVIASGETKYPPDQDGTPNWHRLSVKEQLNHMLTHVMAYLSGDTQDDHLEHMACRALMALERKYLDEKSSQEFFKQYGEKFLHGLKQDAKACDSERAIEEMVAKYIFNKNPIAKGSTGVTEDMLRGLKQGDGACNGDGVIYGFQITPEDADLIQQMNDPNLDVGKPTLKCGEARKAGWEIAFDNWTSSNHPASGVGARQAFLDGVKSGMEHCPYLSEACVSAWHAGRDFVNPSNPSK